MYPRSQAVSARAAGVHLPGDHGILALFEKLMQEVNTLYGEVVGVSRQQKSLRLRGQQQVARQVDVLHRARKLAAHPTDQIVTKVLEALALPVKALDVDKEAMEVTTDAYKLEGPKGEIDEKGGELGEGACSRR